MKEEHSNAKKPIVFRMQKKVRFLYLLFGAASLLFAYCVCVMKMTRSSAWQKFVNDFYREFGVGIIGVEIISWLLICLLLGFAYLHFVYAFTCRIKIFEDRLVQCIGFRSQSMYWSEVKKFHSPSFWNRNTMILVSEKGKMSIRPGLLQDCMALIAIIEQSIATSCDS